MLLVLLSLLGYWVFPLRKGSKNYVPRRPLDSFLRTGYERTPTNPHGYHWATDLPTGDIVGVIIQLPVRAKIVWKGWFGDLGRVIEVQILEGYDKGRFVRMCHCEMYTDRPIGSKLPAGFAIARVGLTGHTSGAHDHLELGRYPLRKSRDPRWNPFGRLREAFDSHRWFG